MAVIQIECYRVTCDTCGCDFEDGSGILRHYDWPGDAEGEATDYDWTVWEGHQWCDRHDCVPLCVCGHGLVETHEFGEHPCDVDDCDCRGFEVPPNREDG